MPKLHPNRARATRTARRSGMSVAALAHMPPARRNELMAALNRGELALITSPDGSQFLTPVTPASETP